MAQKVATIKAEEETIEKEAENLLHVNHVQRQADGELSLATV